MSPCNCIALCTKYPESPVRCEHIQENQYRLTLGADIFPDMLAQLTKDDFLIIENVTEPEKIEELSTTAFESICNTPIQVQVSAGDYNPLTGTIVDVLL